MENKNTKPAQPKTKTDIKYTAIRTSKTTANKLKKLQTIINKKDFGCSIIIDQILSYLIENVTPEMITMLQENSLNEEDKFERDYKLYCSKSGRITKNEFFKLVRQGLIFQPANM